jgi:hypothetical protein
LRGALAERAITEHGEATAVEEEADVEIGRASALFEADAEMFEDEDLEDEKEMVTEEVEASVAGPPFDPEMVAGALRMAAGTAASVCGAKAAWGLDLRACWNDMVDLSGRGVCSQEVMLELAAAAESMDKSTVKLDDAGMSGSTLVTSLPDFIIKNVDDTDETLIKAIGGVSQGMQTTHRSKPGGCYQSALAPMCMVLSTPSGVRWLVMKKVGIPGGTVHPVDGVSWLDVKGPKFAGVRDGRSYMAAKKIWEHKDLGFTKLFPQGMKAGACQGKDAAYILERDSMMLKNLKMTDYSLFFTFYDAVESDSCSCRPESAPTFPLVLDVQVDGKKFRMAMGIIDYIEHKVASIIKVASTMKAPDLYQGWWMKMWPMYFHISEELDPLVTNKKLTEGDVEAGRTYIERFNVGDKVTALEKVKWKGQSLAPFSETVYATVDLGDKTIQ